MGRTLVLLMLLLLLHRDRVQGLRDHVAVLLLRNRWGRGRRRRGASPGHGDNCGLRLVLLALNDPGPHAFVSGVALRLPHQVLHLIPEPEDLVRGGLRVQLALLRNLPLLVHDPLEIRQKCRGWRRLAEGGVVLPVELLGLRVVSPGEEV